MKFEDYLKKAKESTATKRSVTGPYASLYPPQYGLTYRMQYNPKSLRKINKKS